MLVSLLFLVCVNYNLSAQHYSEEKKIQIRETVKNAARHAWAGYKKYAWGSDDLRPLTKMPRNWYKHSLLMTPVDAYDTFVLLGLTDEAAEAKKLILDSLSFNKDCDIQVFEITIRQLGALLTAYEIDRDKRFLDLAVDLTDRMMPAFKSKTGMPYRYVHLQTGKVRDSINNPAEIGTLMLEFGKLSQLTGDKKYFDIAKKAIMEVYKRRSGIGLVGERIDINTGEWKSNESHISGYIDSYYEYLYKAWLLFGDKDFKTAFDVHKRAINKYLLHPTSKGIFMRHVNMTSGKQTATMYGALDAFYAGLAAFSGDIKTGRAIQDANFYMWTKFGIEPEEFNYSTDTVTSAYYILRPENLESAFYLWRLTKDRKYLAMGERMINDIEKYCRTEEAYASIRDVRTKTQFNSMESFYFAETLKYAFLLFADDSAVDLKTTVFNTEAHPFKIIKKRK